MAAPEETPHVRALEHWLDGDPNRAVAVWDHILHDHPHEILAFKLAHFLNFWCGRPEAMLASVLSVERHWSDALPGFVALLGCRCFAHEEAGSYLQAEHAGREAVRRDPTDLGLRRTFISTCRMPPRCCFGWAGSAWMSATNGSSWPTRRRLGSATVSPPSRCRTG